MLISSPDFRRIAAELVLHFHKTPSQVSRICSCNIKVVQQCVAEYLQQVGDEPTSESPFIPVVLEDSRSAPPPVLPPIPLELATPGGLTLRFSLSSVQEIAELLQTLQGQSC